MNYIKHLTGFFDRIVSDDRLNPTHISLYLSLFQYWNLNRFQNPISICREEVMKVSKICAKATYHKCMRELHNFGYVQYLPSYNPFKGSLVYLIVFDPDCELVQKTDEYPFKNQTSTGTGTELALVPSINSINILNNINDREENSQSQNELQILKPEEMENLNEGVNTSSDEKAKRKKVAPKKEKEESVRATLDEAITFFKLENFPEIEAHKFFNHFESNGWRVGGKTPMKNWHASARNWMLNSTNFAPKTKTASQNTAKLSNSKNYGEPL